ncbi:MAG: hypothetical protein LBT86_01975 [Deltaproteobacteria bacterium]|jgi:hypothetical protein|nr:hypothetical protein [Deltaproteobacteria bacterium]
MKSRNTIEDEIDAIRIALYEKTKHMTPKELNDYIHTQNIPIYERYGIKPVASIEEYKRNNAINTLNKCSCNK